MLMRRRKVRIETERLTLRLPAHSDYRAWAALRDESRDFLIPWEPTWASDHLTRRAFTNRVLGGPRRDGGDGASGLPDPARRSDAGRGAHA